MKIEYKKRIWYPGACYHVMSRGVRGGLIFKHESDYEIFLQILKECQKRYEFIIAGLSEKLYVIEAGNNSGTRSTVEATLKYRREVQYI